MFIITIIKITLKKVLLIPGGIVLVFTFLYNSKSRWVILEIKDNKETSMISTEGQILPQDYEFLTEFFGGVA